MKNLLRARAIHLGLLSCTLLSLASCARSSSESAEVATELAPGKYTLTSYVNKYPTAGKRRIGGADYENLGTEVRECLTKKLAGSSDRSWNDVASPAILTELILSAKPLDQYGTLEDYYRLKSPECFTPGKSNAACFERENNAKTILKFCDLLVTDAEATTMLGDLFTAATDEDAARTKYLASATRNFRNVDFLNQVFASVVRTGKSKIVATLFELGVDVNAGSGETETILNYTLSKNNPAMVAAVLRAPVSQLNIAIGQQTSASNIRRIAAAGASVNGSGSEKPLARAIKYCHLEAADTLLALGATPVPTDAPCLLEEWKTYKDLGRGDDQKNAREILIANFSIYLRAGLNVNSTGFTFTEEYTNAAAETILMKTTEDTAISKMLVDAGASLFISTPHAESNRAGSYDLTPGMSPFFRAIIGRQVDTFKMFISLNSDPAKWGTASAVVLEGRPIERNEETVYSGFSDSGITPLMMALGIDRNDSAPVQMDIVKAILEAKPDVNARSESGRTALMTAVSRNQADAVRLLLERGADANAATLGTGEKAVMNMDLKGKTPLHFAAESGVSNEILRMLTQAHANLNAQDEWGNTPLMLAVIAAEEACHDRSKRCGRTKELVLELVSAGANRALKNSDGVTASHYATFKTWGFKVSSLKP